MHVVIFSHIMQVIMKSNKLTDISSLNQRPKCYFMQLPNYLIKTLYVLNVMFFSLASARRCLKA